MKISNGIQLEIKTDLLNMFRGVGKKTGYHRLLGVNRRKIQHPRNCYTEKDYQPVNTISRLMAYSTYIQGNGQLNNISPLRYYPLSKQLVAFTH